MERNDVQDFLAMVQGTYPNFNPPDKTAAVNAWTMALGEYRRDEVALAFKLYMKSNTSGFAPTPGQIIDNIHSMKQPEQINEMEAWALVAKALRNGAYHALEEYAKFPPAVQKAVGTHEQLRNWALDEYFNEESAKKSFIFTYRAEVKREQELAKMSSDVRKIYETINQNSYKAQIEDKRHEAIKSLNERKESEIRVLERKREGVLMTDVCKQIMEDMRNG